MILLQKIYIDEDVKSEFVKCPNCGRGRICDKAVGEKAAAISVSPDTNLLKSKATLILKCPRCSSKFFVYKTLDIAQPPDIKQAG